MKLSRDQLISWYFTAAGALGRSAPDAEAQFLAQLPKLASRERLGVAAGFRQGINDLLEMSEFWPLEKDELVDAALSAKGLPKLAEMRSVRHRKEAKILRRGTIKNEEEFHVANESLSDLDSDLTARQREKLGHMVIEYEQKTKTA